MVIQRGQKDQEDNPKSHDETAPFADQTAAPSHRCVLSSSDTRASLRDNNKQRVHARAAAGEGAEGVTKLKFTLQFFLGAGNMALSACGILYVD